MQGSSASHGAAARGAKPGSGALSLTAVLFERAAKSLLLSHELDNLVQFKLCLFRSVPSKYVVIGISSRRTILMLADHEKNALRRG